MTKPSNTYFAGSTLCVTGIQLPLSGESKSRKQGQFLRYRNTWMWVVMRKILLCIYQLSKTRAPCHHFKIFLRHLYECVILFSLFSITCKAHGSLRKTKEALCYVSSPPFHLLPRLAFLPTHLGLWRTILRQRPPEDMPVYRWAQGHPRHPSSPSCHSPLCQLHILCVA